MVAEHATPPVPMNHVMAWELELIGSHGMAAHEYPSMLGAVVPEALAAMGGPATGAGMTVIIPTR